MHNPPHGHNGLKWGILKAITLSSEGSRPTQCWIPVHFSMKVRPLNLHQYVRCLAAKRNRSVTVHQGSLIAFHQVARTAEILRGTSAPTKATEEEEERCWENDIVLSITIGKQCLQPSFTLYPMSTLKTITPEYFFESPTSNATGKRARSSHRAASFFLFMYSFFFMWILFE